VLLVILAAGIAAYLRWHGVLGRIAWQLLHPH
jgi:hypothetical protein